MFRGDPTKTESLKPQADAFRRRMMYEETGKGLGAMTSP